MYFPDEIRDLQSKKSVSSSSSMSTLAPFLDDTGVLRVGGRIRKANLPYTTRHAVILPKSTECRVSKNVIHAYHHKLAHGGRDLMMGLLLEKYHIIGAGQFVKRLIRSCVPCRRRNARVSEQFMGDLPSERTNRVSRLLVLTASAPSRAKLGAEIPSIMAYYSYV